MCLFRLVSPTMSPFYRFKGTNRLKYFHNQKKYISPTGLLNDLQQLVFAVVRAFKKDSRQVKGRKRLYASSLAFKTALALVPALAILMAVLAGDGFTQKREQMLDKIVDVIYPVETSDEVGTIGPPEPQELRQLREAGRTKIHWMVNRFAKQAEKMGIAGFAVFSVVLFLLLRDVEDSFNFLWGVEKGRPFLAQVFRFGYLLIGAPLLAGMLLSFRAWFQGGVILKTWLGSWLLSTALPFLCLWAVCGWMYHWLPNTKTSFKTASSAGFLAAILLEGGQWLVGWYTLHVVASSKIYGALWTIPVILIWFYLSWTIVLFGAEVAYFLQQHRNERAR